jgi:hypothetical protein
MRCLGTSFRSFSTTRNAAWVFNAAQGDEKTAHCFCVIEQPEPQFAPITKNLFCDKKVIS